LRFPLTDVSPLKRFSFYLHSRNSSLAIYNEGNFRNSGVHLARQTIQIRKSKQSDELNALLQEQKSATEQQVEEEEKEVAI